jgi:hypothetical protein
MSWHKGSAPDPTVIADGNPTDGLMVTLRITCTDGPLHPFAVTWMLTVPKKPLVQVITPVVAFIVPAAGLLIDQLKPVLFEAVVAYEVVVEALMSWQVGSVPAAVVIAVGLPSVCPTVTDLINCDEGPLHPEAVTWIFTVPKKPFVQVITPVDALIDPAAGLFIDQLKPVLFAAEVEYVVVVVLFSGWHTGSDPADMDIATGVATVGVTVRATLTEVTVGQVYPAIPPIKTV